MIALPVALMAALQTAGVPPAPKAVPSLRCSHKIDMNWRPKGSLMLLWAEVEIGRIRGLDVYDQGDFSLRVQEDDDLTDCDGKISLDRVAKLKADLVKTKACRFFTTKKNRPPRVAAYMDLGPSFRCHFDLKPAAWRKSPVTRAVQEAIDGLLRDICGDSCPTPRRPMQ